jgi:sugar phosphate isomerase/epimerase
VRRRDWIAGAAAGALACAGAAWTARAGEEPPGRPDRRARSDTAPGGSATAFPVGVQLYTLRSLLDADLAGTLREVAAIGYAEVELAGLHGATPAAFRAHLDHAGLTAPSSHVSIEEVRGDLDRLLGDAATLGVRTLVVPWLDASERTADGYRGVAEDLNAAGEAARASGVRMGYHNQAYDHAPLGGGTGWDLLLESTDPALVTMQMDVFWAVAGGASPLAYLRAYGGRFASLHLKDRTTSGDMVDVGAGMVDFAAILGAARAQGLEHAFVEHDEPGEPLASIRASYEHLAGLES